MLQLIALMVSAPALHIAITGSSQGIGAAAAKVLISEGHEVYHACRSAERAEAARLAAGGGTALVCDLADLDSVRGFAEALRHAAPRLDVLCLNAAVAPSTKATVAPRTKQNIEECIGVNHLGHFLLACLLQPHLSANDGAARIVITASSVHDPEQPGGAVGGKGGATLGSLGGLREGLRDPMGATMVDGAATYDGSKVYKDSKLANLLFAGEAQRRWGGAGISVRTFNPGFIPSSGLFREPRKDNFLGATAFTFFARLAGFAVPIEVGGERLAYLASAPDAQIPPGSYLGGPTGSRGTTREDGFGDGLLSAEARDEDKARLLWELSAAAVGVASA